MMIHDTSLDDLAEVYPRKIRRYYLTMLRPNLRRAQRVLTVSQGSRRAGCFNSSRLASPRVL
jgi:hypothetical protein